MSSGAGAGSAIATGPTTLSRTFETLARKYQRPSRRTLCRIRRLLRTLGDPQERMPPAVHVAGTNGKGSTVAILRAIFEAAGYRAHVYTSPDIERFNERIRLAGRLIDDDALNAVLTEVDGRNGNAESTFFEITTAAAFLAFSRVPADVVLLEAGCGGANDATNAIAAPACSVVTPVGIDHTEFFGPGLAEIAEEKAGILKPRCPCAIGRQTATASAVLEARARKIGAPLHRMGPDWQAVPCGSHWRYESADRVLEFPLPGLPGRHQIDNAGLAVACLTRLKGFELTVESIAKGLGRIEWPGRMQRLTGGRLAQLLGARHQLWIDGAHNAHAFAMLAQQAELWRDRPLFLIFGAVQCREPADLLTEIAPAVAGLQAVAIPEEPRSHAPETVLRAAEGLRIAAQAAASIGDAIVAIRETVKEPVRVLICGSLYLAGAALAANG